MLAGARIDPRIKSGDGNDGAGIAREAMPRTVGITWTFLVISLGLGAFVVETPWTAT
jgi:hypothetical protein